MNTRFFLKSKPNDSEGTIYFLFSTEYGKIKVSTGETIPKKNWEKGSPNKSANMTIRQLLIRTKKLRAFNVSINQIIGADSINNTDLKLLSSKYAMSAYQKVLKTYRNQ